MEPKLTIVTVTYNCENLIECTLLSVIEQSYLNIEYIVIDGGSNDDTIKIIKRYSDSIDVFISEPDKGIYDAMNKGIKRATGEYIEFLNAGDCFLNLDSLKSVGFEKLQAFDIIFCNNVIFQRGRFYEMVAHPFYEHKDVKHSMGFNHQATFVRTQLAKSNPFNLSYKLAADYNMIMTLYHQGYKFYHVNIPLVYYDSNGISEQRRIQHMKEIREIGGETLSKIKSLKLLLILKFCSLKSKMGDYAYKHLLKNQDKRLSSANREYKLKIKYLEYTKK